MMTKVAAFAVMSLILTVTPGPDSLLVLRSSLLGGRRTGVRVAGGATAGSLAWGICSAVGLTAILAASSQLYLAVQPAGACYLVLLGIRGLRATGGHTSPSRLERRPGFRTGLLSNLLNPKIGLFFLAITPQLIPHHAPCARASTRQSRSPARPVKAAIDVPLARAIVGPVLVIVIAPSLIPGLMPPTM